MGSSWTIGRFTGVDLKIHVTFPLLLFWYGIQAYQYGGLSAATNIVLLVLAVFACVVFHEFGHVLMARHFGIGTRDVVLLPIGGVARLEYFPTKPRQEMLIALAGPAVTLAIIVILYALVRLFDGVGGPVTTLSVGQGFLFNLLVVNIYLLVFNLIPAFPMDGGRVLRAALASRMGFVRGTKIAATVGKSLAVVGGLYAVYPVISGGSISWILLLIAGFVFMAASGEAAAVEGRAPSESGRDPNR